VAASDPRASVLVIANAGSGKTSTLVKRVARLLLAGAPPEAILCVTFTKAGAAEMQRRLFKDLGAWAVMDDARLERALEEIDETGRALPSARALFARALETPGGLKIQTIHAFCEKLLRRFPLEAGVSPGFQVLEEADAAEVSARARDQVAEQVLAAPGSALARAYAHMAVELDWAAFNAMFATFENRRARIGAYVDACDGRGGYVIETWRRCGFPEPTSVAAIEAEALSRIRWRRWRQAAQALAASGASTDQALAAAMAAAEAVGAAAEAMGAAAETTGGYDAAAAVFFTGTGEPRKRLGTQQIDAATRAWLAEEQARHVETRARLFAAKVAEDTVHALTVAIAHGACHADEKARRGALDFDDLIDRARRLLSERSDAAWVLYKMDGGLRHVLLDEAQDTAPTQWAILRSLTQEFFSGQGAATGARTMFAVGDPKQSIFSFQGADPRRLGAEGQALEGRVATAGARFARVDLRVSWRSRPEILAFVDTVSAMPAVLAGLNPSEPGRVVPFPGVRHIARLPAGGCVELWPLQAGEDAEDDDPWAPVDAEPPRGANRLLAQRVAQSIKAAVARGDGVMDKEGEPGALRPCRFGDVLILVRRRKSLFHEIIRALKREGVPVSGADRLKLSDHGVFEDLMALGRFARFSTDDLTLAGLLRSPFCDLDEESLFDLAHPRRGSLWGALKARQAERPEWRGALAFLAWARGQSRTVSPFAFYAQVLSRLDGEAGVGRSMRQRILTRLGDEAADALDAFVAQALAAESRGIRDLERFLAVMAATELDIKREPGEARTRGEGEVRVMTVHGAKGLEAPIVILPDTSTRARSMREALLEDEDGAFYWAPRAGEDCPASAAARARREAAGDQEQARLLYVALTRARDRLIVCGVQGAAAWFTGSWYDLVNLAFDVLPSVPVALDGGGEGRLHGVAPEPAAPATAEIPLAADPPAWVARPASEEPSMAAAASPSRLSRRVAWPAPSPLAAVGGLGRFRRGDLIHRLLQRLADIPADARADAARRILDRELDLTARQRVEVAAAALGVLGDARFAAVFGPGSRAEVALTGTTARLPAGPRIVGQVDRLVVRADRVLVIDFKTNRPAPDRIEDADPDYVRQMALYWAILTEIHPGRPVEAALIWTDGPRLTPIPEAMMIAALDDMSLAPGAAAP
jgi:ATP-dependent helicase/nuclease subunit A